VTVVRGYPRLHFGLADLGRATARAYGGSGVSLDGLSVDVEARISRRHSLIGFDRLSDRAKDEVSAAVRRLEAELPGEPAFQLTLLSDLREHVGLGSKTALVLAALQASVLAAGATVNRRRLQMLSHRGGASGVGVHAFFLGGLVVDAGHPQRDVEQLVPSAARAPADVPRLIGRFDFPEDWRIRLALPAGARLSGRSEIEFFERATPIPSSEVFETIAILHHGILPAVVEADFEALHKSLTALQLCGFKGREVAAQPPAVRALLERCQAIGPAGLSSLGPLVFAVVGSRAQEEALDDIVAQSDAADLGTWSVRDRGFEVVKP